MDWTRVWIWMDVVLGVGSASDLMVFLSCPVLSSPTLSYPVLFSCKPN